jgi:uncharacterized protein (DUF697 family)
MDEAWYMSWITAWLDNVSEMIELFGTVVTKDQGLELTVDLLVSAVLVGIGGLLTLFAMAVFGILTLGAVSGLVTESS